jgi:O-methyltransferase domain/Dimerisation domain
MRAVADEAPAATLKRLIDGYEVSQAIHVAAVLGIADLLAEAPRTADELATSTGTNRNALRRLLRALAAVGVFDEDEGGAFSLTAVGDGLRRDTPSSLAAWATFIGRPHHWDAWGQLLAGVETGDNAFKILHGIDVWTYRAEHPEEGDVFDAAMVAMTRRTNASVLDAYDFNGFATLVDVGGGRGTFVAALLATYPSLHGVLFDQPHVLAGAQELLREAGVADRCRVVGGSFFDEVPDGADAYLLKSILHDWEDDEATAILRTCRHAIGAGGTVLVVERVVGPPNEGADTKFSDLNMFVKTGGRERDLREFEALFDAAGFRLDHETPTASGFSVIAATPAQARS